MGPTAVALSFYGVDSEHLETVAVSLVVRVLLEVCDSDPCPIIAGLEVDTGTICRH